MPIFLFTATNSEGVVVTDRMEEPTLSAAKYKLELRGYKDLIFHTDEMAARSDAAINAEYPGAVPPNALTPEQELEARRGGGVLREIWCAWKLNGIFWGPLLLWTAITVYQGRPYGWFDLTGFVLSGIFLIYFFKLVLPGVAYQKLLEAGVHFRWEEARRWVRCIRFLKRTAFVPIPELELDFRAAYSLAAQGKLEEALRMTEKYAEHSCGKFQYFSRRSGLYEAARDYPAMTRDRQLAAEHGSGKPEEKLDLALGLLRRERKPREAKLIMDAIDLSDCGELVAIFHEYCLGLLAVETGAWADAEKRLRRAIELSQPYKNNILMAGMLKDIKAYLSLALASLGNFTAATSLLREVEPLLRLRREDELIGRCRAALGLPGGDVRVG